MPVVPVVPVACLWPVIPCHGMQKGPALFACHRIASHRIPPPPVADSNPLPKPISALSIT